jgi:citrate lyase subunit beta-like protein
MATNRRRRALLYVPGDDLHKIKKAITLKVDSICLDLEDGVAAKCKSDAQRVIKNALIELNFCDSEKLVRINPIQSGMMEEDLKVILEAKPDGIVLPKVENAEGIKMVSARISDSELKHKWEPGSIQMIAICESAEGILNLHEICHADPRLNGVIFGGEDLAADLGAKRTRDAREIFLARSLVVLHAAAARIQAIDLVCTDFLDIDLVRAEAEEGARMGFSGKQVIHPNQVDVVQTAFTPSAEEIQEAMQVIRAFQKNANRGKGAFALGGKMVDLPVVKRAQNILQRAGITADSLEG